MEVGPSSSPQPHIKDASLSPSWQKRRSQGSYGPHLGAATPGPSLPTLVMPHPVTQHSVRGLTLRETAGSGTMSMTEDSLSGACSCSSAMSAPTVPIQLLLNLGWEITCFTATRWSCS